MPLYPFRCVTCDYTEEEFYGLNEPKPTICPKCGQNTLTQEIGVTSSWHPASAIFTGKNWEWVQKRSALAIKNNDDRRK